MLRGVLSFLSYPLLKANSRREGSLCTTKPKPQDIGIEKNSVLRVLFYV